MTVSGDTTYYYIVTACNAHGESNDSNETVAVTGVLTTYLKFDEVSGSTAADSSGNGWDAMLYNGPSWVSGVYGIISIAIILVAFPAAFGSSMEKRYQDALRDHGAGDSKVAGAKSASDAIYSGIPWYDNNGNIVSAHSAGIIKEAGLYYLFGEFKSDTNNAFTGFSCYSSRDLYNWTFETIALPVQESGRLGPNRVGERPKVMKCPQTGEYVMYMHTDDLNYKDPAVGYATCDTINGQYTFQGPLKFNGDPVQKWDMGVFQDDDGSGYLITHSGYLYKLSDDYKSIVKKVVDNMTGACEAPTIFKKDGTYYWLGSDLTGWERNDNYYFTASLLEGPWVSRGYFAPKGSLTWNSQTTFVLPIAGTEGTTYMYMGDRWAYPRQHSAATYVWQPLVFDGDAIALPDYKQSWKINTSTGTWAVSSVEGEIIENTDMDRIEYSDGWEATILADGFSDHRSDVKGASFSLEFEGSRIGLYGVARPNGGFGRVEIADGNETIISTIIEMYCAYPESSLKFLSPVLKPGNYKLTVTVLGEHGNWTTKNGTVWGSTDDFISVDRIVVISGE